jgi:hypothetical protein
MSRSRTLGKEPLFRRVNTRTHNVRHNFGGEYRWSRQRNDSLEGRGSMHAGKRRGRDYTPLFRFLLSRVGKDWTDVHHEAVSRLDDEEPIFWLVARTEAEKRPSVLLGENSYYSGLYIDENNRLAIVDPALSVEQMEPSCSCCTHTFNGIPFTRPCRGR